MSLFPRFLLLTSLTIKGILVHTAGFSREGNDVCWGDSGDGAICEAYMTLENGCSGVYDSGDTEGWYKCMCEDGQIAVQQA